MLSAFSVSFDYGNCFISLLTFSKTHSSPNSVTQQTSVFVFSFVVDVQFYFVLITKYITLFFFMEFIFHILYLFLCLVQLFVVFTFNTLKHLFGSYFVEYSPNHSSELLEISHHLPCKDSVLQNQQFWRYYWFFLGFCVFLFVCF